MFRCQTVATLIIGPVLLGVLVFRWLDDPVPGGYSPESTVTLRALLMSVKAIITVADVAHRVGIGSSFSPNQRYINNYFQNIVTEQATDRDNIKEVDHVFDGVPVRVYEPLNRTGVLPGFVWYHGGGWVVGNLNGAADTARRLCRETNSVIVSVDYRLAPEHVFPAAFDDCLTATKYFMTNAEKFHINPMRVAIGGDSSGGNLAAAVTLRLRDEAFQPALKLQVLVYPVAQALDLQLPSYTKYADGPILSRSMMARYILAYALGNERMADILLENGHLSPAVKKTGLPFIDVSKLPNKYLVGYTKPSVETGSETVWNEMKDKLLNPYFSPLVADRLDNLPPAYVFTAEHDPLRDEGILYAERLKESGVTVKHHHSEIGFHGIAQFFKLLPEADEIFSEMTGFIVENL